jgi:hypothetical protein
MVVSSVAAMGGGRRGWNVAFYRCVHINERHSIIYLVLAVRQFFALQGVLKYIMMLIQLAPPGGGHDHHDKLP